MIPWQRIRTAIRQPRKVTRAYIERLRHGMALAWKYRRTHSFRLWLRFYRKLTGREVVVFVRHGGIGDIVCTFPAVKALRERHPQALLIYAVWPEFREVVEMGGVADVIFPIEGREYQPQLEPGEYDFLYQPKLEDEEPKGRPPAHLAADFCQTLGVEPSSLQSQLKVPGPVRGEMAGRVKACRAAHRHVLGVHVGPSWKVREWPEEHWRNLVEGLRRELDCVIIQLGSDVDTTRGTIPVVRLPGTSDWVGKLDLVETCATLQALDLFIGIDSGLLHLSGAVGTPMLGLFGAIAPELRLPLEGVARGVTSNVPCLGCHHRLPRLHWQTGCPHEIICMQQLSPESVLTAAKELLARKTST